MTQADPVDLYNSGLSIRAISSRAGIPRENVRIALHRLGVQMRHIHPIYSLARTLLDFDSALLLGLHAGDGYLSGAWGLSIHSKDVRMTHEVIVLAREVLGIEPGIRTRDDHTTTVWSWKRQAVDFFKRYGFPEGRKAGIVTVPQAIFQASIEVKRAFLRGLFSSDGCFYTKGRRGEIRFEASSKPLRDGFVLLASQLGFVFHGYSYVHHGGHNKLSLHLAYLGRQPQVLRWMEEVGSICDTHLERYSTLKNVLRESHVP